MIKKLILKLKNSSLQIYIDVFLIVLALFLGIYFKWNIIETAFFGILIGIILYPVPSRYLAVFAFIFIALASVFMPLENKVISEKMAIYAYYFLIMALLMAIYELEKKDNKKET